MPGVLVFLVYIGGIGTETVKLVTYMFSLS